jgi:hypothetical protein
VVVTRKYALPSFLGGVIAQGAYDRWLHRKADAHIKRDRKPGLTANNESYKVAIHQAVCQSNGLDAYTREELHWHLISKYDNEESGKGRSIYKAQFGLLPTVDHVGNGTGAADFRICGWRTNDAKNDLSLTEFVALCQRVVAAHASLLASPPLAAESSRILSGNPDPQRSPQ